MGLYRARIKWVIYLGLRLKRARPAIFQNSTTLAGYIAPQPDEDGNDGLRSRRTIHITHITHFSYTLLHVSNHPSSTSRLYVYTTLLINTLRQHRFRHSSC